MTKVDRLPSPNRQNYLLRGRANLQDLSEVWQGAERRALPCGLRRHMIGSNLWPSGMTRSRLQLVFALFYEVQI